MREISDQEAKKRGISAVHHEMENGEMRFRLVSDSGSSYILTKSPANTGWQNSHVHCVKREYYIVEKGSMYIAMLTDGKLQIQKLCENDSILIPAGVAHNALMSSDAIVHTVKFGTVDEDWNSCPELDALLESADIQSLL